ncbi:MAG: FAD-binding protein [Acidobacteria bacterium]|nr:FAD-binding protein [Acidobacteriota bacterium]
MRDEVRRFPPLDLHRSGPVPERIEHEDRVQHVNVEAAALAEALRRNVKGEVRFDDASRALYATDASNYRQVPIGIVIPRDADDVVAAVALAREYGAPILGRGAGTSLAGQCCNVAVVIDCSKYMHRIVELDPTAKFARVEPGIILDDLRNEAEKHNLTFGPDPATHSHCTIGGMVGNNSCGVHAVMAGKTVDNIEELDVLTYDGVRMRVGKTSDEELERILREGGRRGEIYSGLLRLRDRYANLIRQRYPNIPRRVSGYNLDELLPENGFHVARALVGTESTCVMVLEAKCRLVHSPPARTLVLIGYDTVYHAADDVPRILEFGPVGLEGVDDLLIEAEVAKNLNPIGISMLPEGSGWLFVEFGGETQEEANDRARQMMDKIGGSVKSLRMFTDPFEQKAVWQVRESGLGATAYTPGKPRTWEGWEDAAVAPQKLGGYLRDLRKLLDRYHYVGDLYGHFGQGCVHTRTNFDLQTPNGIAKMRAFVEEAADLVVSYGGSFSGEHGDGQSRAELLPKMYGEELMGAFREFKSLWDPEWKMNPGKVITPYHITENLRLGSDYRPWSPKTHFQFPDDEGRMETAVLRCVGVGKCRRMEMGTMCPSFVATREEEHSTRGRARLLFEMFEGEVIPDNWRNEAVKDALDLCIACKGCKGECPVGVDMATYKAEFLSHYYEGRIRPLAAYAMGWIHIWSRFAQFAPGLANAMMAFPLTRKLLHIAKERQMPRYAESTFEERFRKREHSESRESKRRVMLWPDTFNNHFHPETAMAAVEVLEAAGYHVTLPRKPLCCGRPLYDWGFLGMAKAQLREILDALQPELDEGVPIIGLEPSCISVFRDELPNLFPNDEGAKRLAKSAMTLSEFIAREGDAFHLPRLERKVLTQGHCHHKAVIGYAGEVGLMKKMGLEVEHPDSGCCGMAGAFGFEEEHYDVSMRIGERVLLPKVREAERDTLIVADGFSCREQIAQSTGREALHFAQVLQMALREGPAGPRGELPEERYNEKRPLFPNWPKVLGLGIAAGALVGLVALSRKWRK